MSSTFFNTAQKLIIRTSKKSTKPGFPSGKLPVRRTPKRFLATSSRSLNPGPERQKNIGQLLWLNLAMAAQLHWFWLLSRG